MPYVDSSKLQSHEMRVRHVLCPGNPLTITQIERVAPSACKHHLYSPKHIIFLWPLSPTVVI